jgi:outer membrane protein TolC
VAGITFSTDYTLVTNPPTNAVLPDGTTINFLNVNPQYRPKLQFQFEQPLLQNFGVEINQLRSNHPNSVLTPYTTNLRTEGILITRLRFDQQRSEFERNVNILLFNVEVAYWNLYGAYWTLYSREQALRQAFEAWRINRTRFEQGQVAPQDLAQARQQYELFRGQRLSALGDVLERERQLRGLLGMPMEDGYRIVPSDAPTLTPFQPDWYLALDETMSLRPELVLARQELKVRQLDLIAQKNLLRPDLRFLSTYDINGLGTQLDGASPLNVPMSNFKGNALGNFTSNKYNSWSLGLNLEIPLGYREAHAAVRIARLNLARSYEVLKDQEEKAQRLLGLYYRRVIEYYDQILIQRAQREAATVQLETRFQQFEAGQGTLDLLLESQRVWADALRGEYDAIVQYNSALAGLQYAKGTIQHYDNVHVAEGPLPYCAQVRAVDHAQEQTKALILRLRTQPTIGPDCGEPGQGIPRVPHLPADKAAALPEVIEPPSPDSELLPTSARCFGDILAPRFPTIDGR